MPFGHCEVTRLATHRASAQERRAFMAQSERFRWSPTSWPRRKESSSSDSFCKGSEPSTASRV